MGLINGAHHIAVKCDNEEMFKEAVRFYNEVLGMEIIREWGEGASKGMMISTGDCLMELFASGRNQTEGGTVNHIALKTDDVDACVKACVDAGFKLKVEPTDIVIGSVPPFPARMAFVYGAAGEEVEFFTEK